MKIYKFDSWTWTCVMSKFLYSVTSTFFQNAAKELEILGLCRSKINGQLTGQALHYCLWKSIKRSFKYFEQRLKDAYIRNSFLNVYTCH